MNTNQGALYFGAGIDLNQFNRDLASMRAGIAGLTQTAATETRNIDGYFKNLSVGIAGYFSIGAIKNFAMELINVRGEFQKTEIAFSTMLRSGDKAKVLMAQMVDLAAKTPFSLQDVSAGAKQLLAFQVPANQVVDVLTRMGNIAAGLGVPLSRINLVYGQVKAKGKLMGDDLRQFTEAGIPMVAELAKKFNKTTAEVSAMVSAGKVGFKDVQEVLYSLTNEGGMFFNLMEKQSASVSGKIANLGDAWDQMLNKIGQGNEGLIYSGIAGLTDLVEHYQELFEIIKTLVVAYGTYKAAIIVTSAAQALTNKTLATEIGLLSFSQRMKLGRAIVTQRQTAATLLEAQAERASLATKYATLQAEVASLSVKKQKAIAMGIERTQAVGNARVQLALAQAELRSITANGTAREVLIATKNVEKAQNTVIAAQDSASIARKTALAASTQFQTAQQQLKNTATALSAATNAVETSTEIAQTAAKTANAIATQRLTLAQMAQTVAMTAATKAAALLNRTLFANPYALAAALIAALTYAIYKYSTALTVAEESQRKMDEDRKSQIPSITEQESKIKALTKVIQDQTSSEDKKASAIKQIKAITNGRLAQLDEEAIKTGKATDMIKKYIEMLKLEAEAKRYVNELGRLDAEIDDLKTNKNKFGVGDVWDDFTDFDSDFQWNLKDRKKQRVDKAVKDMTEEKKEIQKKLDDLAKRGVNISETEVTEEKKAGKSGWAKRIKDQIEALEAEADSAPTRQAFFRIQAKIKKLQDLLNPPKEKDKQLAEIIPMGSIKELQRRSGLLQEAIDTAINGMVKLRKLDKYGKDTDKSGNPFFTGEIVSMEEAGKRLDALNEAIKNKQYKNFQERIDEAERQWNNYYKMAEFYGKESADAQYKDLFKGSQSYLSYLEQQEQALKDLSEKGILSDKQKQDMVFLQSKIRELDGTETPLENFKRGINDALKAMPSLVDQIEYLNAAEYGASMKAGANTGPFLESKKYIEEQIKNIQQQQKDTYQEFLNEQISFEQKKLEIEQKYNDIRKKIGTDQSITDTERLKRLTQTTKKEGEEIGSASLEAFKKTDLWVKAFGDLERTGPKTLARLKKGLEDYLKTSEGKGLPATETKEIQDQIKKLNDIVNTNNPYKAIGIAVDAYKKKRQELNEVERKSGKDNVSYLQKLEETNQAFVNIIDVSGDAAKATLQVIDTMGNAFGGLSDELKQSLAEVQQLVEGVVNAVAGYFSGNYGQMISGIVQIAGALTKILNGDKDRERQIQAWQVAVEDLKLSYQELQYVIEKTAGEGQIKMQRELISNLKEQQRVLDKMRSNEAAKKNADNGKIATYTQQINEINQQIQKLIDDFQSSITSTEFRELSEKISDALIDAFGKGEDAAASFEKVVDEVMRNAVANALRIKILEPAVKNMVDSLYSSMGFGGNSGATADQASQLKDYQDQITDIEKKLLTANSIKAADLNNLKNYLLDKIKVLNQQIAANAMSGSFDGLTPEERENIKNMGTTAMDQYMAALEQYKDLFGESAENAQGLKGDIKGMTEKTAGALEGQFNAMRINIGEVLKIMQGNKIMENAKTNLLSQIEVNTRNLVQIRKDMAELNSKVKYGAAGIP